MERLDTKIKAYDFVRSFGALRFVFATDNIITYETVIPKMINDYLVDYNFSFFIEECSTFYNMDSMNNFLEALELFEIIEICEETNIKNILYHKKHDSSDIFTFNESINKVDDSKDKIDFTEDIKVFELLDLEDELRMLILDEDYEEASNVRDKIKKLKNNESKF